MAICGRTGRQSDPLLLRRPYIYLHFVCPDKGNSSTMLLSLRLLNPLPSCAENITIDEVPLHNSSAYHLGIPKVSVLARWLAHLSKTTWTLLVYPTKNNAASSLKRSSFGQSSARMGVLAPKMCRGTPIDSCRA